MITITGVGDYDETKGIYEQEEAVVDYVLQYIDGNTPTLENKEFCGRNVDGKDIYRTKKREFTDNDKSVKIIENRTFLYPSNNRQAFKIGRETIIVEEI